MLINTKKTKLGEAYLSNSVDWLKTVSDGHIRLNRQAIPIAYSRWLQLAHHAHHNKVKPTA